MRVALVAHGTRGDVQPLVVLGMRLAARGARPFVVAPAEQEALVRSAGLPFELLPGDPGPLLRSPEGRALFAAGRTSEWLAALARVVRENAPLWRDILDDVASRADVVTSGTVTALPACAAALDAGRRAVAVLPYPLGWTGDLAGRAMERLFLEPFRPWLERRGAVRGPLFAALVARGARPVLAWSPSLAPALDPALPPPSGTIVPTTEEAMRLGDGPLAADLDAWLETGPPPVLVGFGSMPSPAGAGSVAALVSRLRARGERVLVSGDAPGVSDEEHVQVVSRLDHVAVLSRCRAMVHHGGSGTTHAGLRAGRPMLVLSWLLDQVLWGHAVEQHGAGAWLPAVGTDTARVDAALDRVLAPGAARAAEALGGRMATEDGAQDALAAIEGTSSDAGRRR